MEDVGVEGTDEDLAGEEGGVTWGDLEEPKYNNQS